MDFQCHRLYKALIKHACVAAHCVKGQGEEETRASSLSDCLHVFPYLTFFLSRHYGRCNPFLTSCFRGEQVPAGVLLVTETSS